MTRSLFARQFTPTGSNKFDSFNFTGMPGGTIVSASINMPAAVSQLHGRYYGQIKVFESTSNAIGVGQDGLIWSGYVVRAQNPLSMVGLRMRQGWQLTVNLAGGSNAVSTDVFEVEVVIEDDPRVPIAGSWIFFEPAYSGEGDQVFTAISNPAAGADPAAQTAPNQVRSLLKSFFGTLVTSTGAVLREPQVTVNDTGQTKTVKKQTVGGKVPASITAQISFFVGGQPNYSNETSLTSTATTIGALDPLKTRPPQQWTLTANAIQAADQWSNLEFETAEWAGPDP